MKVWIGNNAPKVSIQLFYSLISVTVKRRYSFALSQVHLLIRLWINNNNNKRLVALVFQNESTSWGINIFIKKLVRVARQSTCKKNSFHMKGCTVSFFSRGNAQQQLKNGLLRYQWILKLKYCVLLIKKKFTVFVRDSFCLCKFKGIKHWLRIVKHWRK